MQALFQHCSFGCNGVGVCTPTVTRVGKKVDDE